MIQKHILKPFILAILLIVLTLFLFLAVINTRSQLLAQFRYQKNVENLQVINKKFDMFFQKKISYTDNDKITASEKAFETEMGQLKENSIFQDMIKENDFLDLFNQINDKFHIKNDLIEQYKSTMGATVNSLRYISVLQENIVANSDNLEKDRALLVLYTKVMQLGFNESVNQKSFFDAVAALSHSPVAESELKNEVALFITHATYVYQQQTQLEHIIHDAHNLHLDTALNVFSQKSYNSLRRHTSQIMLVFFTLTGFLLLLVLYTGWVLRENHKREEELSYYKAGVDQSDNSVMLTDIQHRIIYVNKAFEKLSGYKADEVIGQTPGMLQSGRHDDDFYAKLNKTISAGQVWRGEFINRTKNGKTYIEKVSINPIFDRNNEIRFYMAIKLDISREKAHKEMILAKNKEMIDRYYQDDLTNLPNRNRLLKDLTKEKVCCLVLLNIDAFKEINDFYGIKKGDEVLQNFAHILENIHCHQVYRVYRTHADEFALLIDSLAKKEHIDALMESLEEAIHTSSLGEKIPFSFSAGISYSGLQQPVNKSILTDADLALKHAKNSSHSYTFYEKSFQIANEFETNMLWLKKLKSAIHADRIIPYFQPVINRQTGKILYYESLMRMIDENGNVITPYFFLDIAKKAKLYIALTTIMIEKTFAAFKGSEDAFSINISYEDMRDEKVIGLLEEKIKGLSKPENFSVEILESESIHNYEVAKDFINMVKSYGCGVAIDDFGSGYSNFERVFQLNIDYLKIDGSIIRGIDTDRQLRIITETIVAFARKSDKKVIAEFVHSEKIAEILEEMGVYNLQGFYFSEPLQAPTYDIKESAYTVKSL